jgi:hypothetical protein
MSARIQSIAAGSSDDPVINSLIDFAKNGFSIRILPEPLAMILGIVCLLAGPSLALPALFTMRAAGTHANPPSQRW